MKMESNFVLRNIDGIWFGISPKLAEQGIKHAFTTKLHGKSIVIPDSLNMSLHVNDDNDFIIENRRYVCSALRVNFEKLTTPKQVHGDHIVYVDNSLAGRGRLSFDDAIEGTDALFTDVPGLPLMLLFADCTPIIISDPVKKVVAVVHTGWRSTVQNIVQKTVAKMSGKLSVNPEDCLAIIGPSMGPGCYQVGEEVYFAAQKNLADYRSLFIEKDNKQWLFNMWKANARQLMNAGLKATNMVTSEICTQCDKELFFSHRADQGRTGRFAAIAWL